MMTYEEALKHSPAPTRLNKLVAGSWVYGSFSTWIGEADKNRGWDLLCDAKVATDKAIASKKFSKDQLQLINDALAICEGSDWFWWFGDYNPAQSVKDFERLFRQHLTNLYEAIEEPVPADLKKVISEGGGDPAAGGVMRQGHEESV